MIGGCVSPPPPPAEMTFEPHQVLQGVWQEVKGEATAVNEAEYTSVIVWTVGPEDRQQGCKVSVVIRMWCCSVTQEMSCVGGVGSVAEWLCVHFGLVEAVWFFWGLFVVDFWWPVNT